MGGGESRFLGSDSPCSVRWRHGEAAIGVPPHLSPTPNGPATPRLRRTGRGGVRSRKGCLLTSALTIKLNYAREQKSPSPSLLKRKSEALLGMEPSEEYLFEHKGFYFVRDLVTSEYIDSLKDFEIRDSDVFLATYPKSGTVWTQQILSLIYHEGHRDGTENIPLIDRVPWLEYRDVIYQRDYVNRTSPRLFTTHLPYYLVPKGLRNGRAKVIYVARNPKDVCVSFYHYCKTSVVLEEVEDFNVSMESFLAGKVAASSWLDHIEGWSAHRDDFNILFLTYEEMKKDLRSSILKICNFLGKRLTDKVVDDIVDKASMANMRVDPRTNPDIFVPTLLDLNKGSFLRKGTIGDWKGMMTVAQSERFDRVVKERMEKLPFKFCWDINDDL